MEIQENDEQYQLINYDQDQNQYYINQELNEEKHFTDTTLQILNQGKNK